MTHITTEIAVGVQIVCRKLSNNNTGGGGHSPYDTVKRVFRHQSVNASDIEKVLKKMPWLSIGQKNNMKSIWLNPDYKKEIIAFVHPLVTPQDALAILERLLSK
jgi:hypothetical protein